VDTAPHHRFGRPVLVDEPRFRGVPLPERESGPLQVLAADDEGARPPGGLLGRELMAEEVEVRWCELHQREILATSERARERVHAEAFVEEMNRAAGDERGDEASD